MFVECWKDFETFFVIKDHVNQCHYSLPLHHDPVAFNSILASWCLLLLLLWLLPLAMLLVGVAVTVWLPLPSTLPSPSPSLSLLPLPLPSHCCPISKSISASWLLFKYSILALLSPPVWHVCWVLKRFLKVFFVIKDHVNQWSIVLFIARIPYLFYILPMSRLGWPAHV